MYKRNAHLVGLLLALILPVLAACGGETPPTGPAATAAPAATTAPAGAATSTTAPAAGGGSKVTLTFWNGFTGPDRPAVEELVKRYNAAHPNVEIQMDILPWDSVRQKLLSTLSTGQGPDLFGMSFGYLPQYVDSGAVLDLTPYFKAGTDLDVANWPPALGDLIKVNGKFYAAPMNYATLLMYYNKDLFKAAGLDPNKPPTTWAEWQAALTKLTQADKGQYGTAIGEHETIPNWPIFIWANGGDIVRNGKSALTDPKTVEALKVWAALVKDQKISPTGLNGADADKLFQSQKAAMEITGPWMTSGFTQAGINYDVAPIPTGSGGPVTLADTVVMMVNKDTKAPDAAVDFVRYWNSKDSQLYFSAQTGFPPARIDLANDPALAQNKWSPKFAAVAPVSRFYLGGQKKFAQIDTDVFVPMIQAITLGKKTVEQATQEADQKLNAILAQP